MGRVTVLLSLCAILVGAAMLGARAAESISIAGDPNSADMRMDISLRDANIQEVLTALFNTTNGRYQLSLDPSVVGRISRLQLSDTPFEKALDAILGTEYSYQRRTSGTNTFLYTITGRSSGMPAASPIRGGTTITNAPPSGSSVPPLTGGSSDASAKPGGFPMLSYSTSRAGASGTGGTGAGTASTSASGEVSVIKMIPVSNMDLELLCTELGGVTLDLFGSTGTTSGGGTSGGGGSSTRSNSTNSDGTSTRATRATNNSSGSGSSSTSTRATRSTKSTSSN
jgi:hypothetical protein